MFLFISFQNRWPEMFPCVVAKAPTTDIIRIGDVGSRSGALQLVSVVLHSRLRVAISISIKPDLVQRDLLRTSLQMRAELQVLSPLVPTREVGFLRFCKQHVDGVWAVVDVSVDGIKENPSAPPTPVSCRRLPSGCLLQDMPNGYSKVLLLHLPALSIGFSHPRHLWPFLS